MEVRVVRRGEQRQVVILAPEIAFYRLLRRVSDFHKTAGIYSAGAGNSVLFLFY